MTHLIIAPTAAPNSSDSLGIKLPLINSLNKACIVSQIKLKIEPITVSYLNKYIKEKVAEDEYLNNVYVRGEISNFKHHYTGHMYFTLKDEGSLIKCIMFKSSTATLNFTPKDGMKVLVLGTVSVFERDRNIPDICKSNERRWDWGLI